MRLKNVNTCIIILYQWGCFFYFSIVVVVVVFMFSFYSSFTIESPFIFHLLKTDCILLLKVCEWFDFGLCVYIICMDVYVYLNMCVNWVRIWNFSGTDTKSFLFRFSIFLYQHYKKKINENNKYFCVNEKCGWLGCNNGRHGRVWVVGKTRLYAITSNTL